MAQVVGCANALRSPNGRKDPGNNARCVHPSIFSTCFGLPDLPLWFPESGCSLSKSQRFVLRSIW